MSIYLVTTPGQGVGSPRTRAQIEADIDATARAYNHTDFEFRVRKGSQVYSFGKGIYDPAGANGNQYVDREVAWSSAGKTFVISCAQAMVQAGIITLNGLIRTYDPSITSTPDTDQITIQHCMDQTHGQTFNGGFPGWWSGAKSLEPGLTRARDLPTEFPHNPPPSFYYTSSSWILLYLAMRGASSVLPNGDIVAYDNVNPHPDWGQIKIWMITNYFPGLSTLKWTWDGAFTFTKSLKLSEYEQYVQDLHAHNVLTPAACEQYFAPIAGEMLQATGGNILGDGLDSKWTSGGFWDLTQRGIDGTYVNGRVTPNRFSSVGIAGQIGFIDRSKNLQFTTGFYTDSGMSGGLRDIHVQGIRGGWDVFLLIETLLYEWESVL